MAPLLIRTLVRRRHAHSRLAPEPAPLLRSPRPHASAGVRNDNAGRYLIWIVAICIIAVLELVCYFVGSGDRFAFPTPSYLYDAASRSEAAKAVIVMVWLGLGWLVVRR